MPSGKQEVASGSRTWEGVSEGGCPERTRPLLQPAFQRASSYGPDLCSGKCLVLCSQPLRNTCKGELGLRAARGQWLQSWLEVFESALDTP